MLKRRHFLAMSGLAAVSGRALFGARFADVQADADALAAKAVNFLRARQNADGSWSAKQSPGVTALVLTGLLRSKKVTPSEPAAAKALEYLRSQIGPNGGLDEGGQANYVTSISLMAFREANANKQFDTAIAAGQKFLKELQWLENKGKNPESEYYGGAGYRGDKSRPDLSNTTFMMEALRDTGLPADDPHLQKALIFVSRCQNLKGEFNDQPWAGKVNDGGFIYTAANGGISVAGNDEATGGLRSYGAMTYAGLKSMIHAGLTPDDPRVKAALKYIGEHYTLEENPGLGQVGLYYYYQVFAKAMTQLGQETFTDAKGVAHDWKAELVAALAKRQAENGSWVNTADRFMEGDANLVTAYGLLALAQVRPAKKG